MTAEVVVVGSFVQDHCWSTDRFPVVGETRVGHFSSGPGGKGFNQAVACHRQGISTLFVGALGADAIADTAHAAGRVVNAAGKGLFSGAGTPILIGAGVLGAVLLLRRGRRHEETE